MQCAVDIAQMIEQGGVGFFAELNRLEQRIERLLRFAKLVEDPAKAVEVSGVLRFELDGFFNHLASLLEILAAIGPHVAKVIEGLGEIGLHLEAFAEILLGFIDSLAALVSGAELKIEQ